MSDPATPELDKRDIRRRRSLVARTTLALFGRTGAAIGGAWIGFTALLAVFAPLLANSRPIVWQVLDTDGNWVTRFPLFAYLTPQDVMLLVGFALLVALAFFYRAGGKLVWVWLVPMAVTVVCTLIFFRIQEFGELSNKLVVARNNYKANPIPAYAKGIDEALWALIKWWATWLTVGLLLLACVALSVVKLARHPRWLIVSGALALVIGSVLLVPSLRVQPRGFYNYEAMRAQLQDGTARDAWFVLVPYSPDDIQVDVKVKHNLLAPGPSPTEAVVADDMLSYMESAYGVRLYELDQAEGIVTSVKTFDQATAVADRLWPAHIARKKAMNDYDPDVAEALNQEVRAQLAEFAATELKTRYYVFGTTQFGQDLCSRMIHGSRIALVIGFIATGIAVFIGVVVGGLLGYFAGWVDLIGLRIVEVFASIPVIMLLIMIVAFYGRSLTLMMIVLGLTGWVGYAYFVRAEFLKLRNMDYVMAARAAGTPLHLILFRHMLPNGVAPVLVGASFGIAGAIMTEATLSFLGLGLENEPSWGQMLNQAREGGSFSWWLAIFPGMAIFLTVFAYNLIGEALRDVIDPRAAK